MYIDAIKVMLQHLNDHQGDMQMAQQWAERHGDEEPGVWSELGAAQLQRGMLKDAISSFIKANNFDHYVNVIDQCNQ